MRHTIILLASGVTCHYPQRHALVSSDPAVGEVCRAQTLEKAQRVQRALELLDRYERGELTELNAEAAD